MGMGKERDTHLKGWTSERSVLNYLISNKALQML
jgi:hypothetical protein